MRTAAITSALVLSLTLALSGCSMVSGLFPGRSSAAPAKELAKIQPTAAVSTLWQVNAGANASDVRIRPLVDDGAVVVAGGGAVSAWSRQNGQSLWKTPVGETITGGVNGGEGLVFAGTATGNAIALDRQTGQVRWVERLGNAVLSVSPASKGRVAFRTADGHLYGLSTQTGEQVWQQLRSTPSLSLRGAGVPVVISDTLVIAGFDNGVITAFDLQTGAGVWEAIISAPRGSSDLDRITDVDGRLKPVGSALFAASYNGQLAGINMRDGKLGWTRAFSSQDGVDADANGLYASRENGEIWKFNPQSGQPVWKMDDLQGRRPGTPTLSGNYLVVGDAEGYLHWINVATGQIAARVRSDVKGYAVAPVSAGNVVYTFGNGGVLAAHAVQ